MPRADSPLLGRMVFLVGANRSGTNWLARLLGLHPDVVVIPAETHFISHGIAVLDDRVHHGLPTSPRTGAVYMDRDGFLDAARDLCDMAFGGVADSLTPGAQRVVEHTPAHVRHLDLVGAVYPDAAVVHLIRDGRDVARSLAAQAWGPGSLADAAHQWVDSVSAARAAAPRLACYHEVRYEMLLADPAGRVLPLYEALGLPVSQDLAERIGHEAAVPFNTDSSDGRIGEGKWRSAWSPREQGIVEEIQGPLLTALGYAVGGPERSGAWSGSARGWPPMDRRAVWARGLSAARRLRTLVAPARGSDPGPGYRMDLAQVTVDRFFEELQAGRTEAAVELLAPDATVRVATSKGVREDQGLAARQLLKEALVDRATLLGPGDRPLRTETVVVHDEQGAILSFLDPDRGPTDELFLMAVREGAVTSLRYYRFPLVGG